MFFCSNLQIYLRYYTGKRSAVIFDEEMWHQFSILVEASKNFETEQTDRALVDKNGKPFTSLSCHLLWIKQFSLASGDSPSYPKKITYGLLRAQAIKDVVNNCDEMSKKTLALKFAHNESTRDKHYNYLAFNSIAVRAVETMKTASKKQLDKAVRAAKTVKTDPKKQLQVVIKQCKRYREHRVASHSVVKKKKTRIKEKWLLSK